MFLAEIAFRRSNREPALQAIREALRETKGIPDEKLLYAGRLLTEIEGAKAGPSPAGRR